MKWFRASFNRIVPVEVDRVTEQCVWIEGRRRSRNGWEGFFPTWAEAHAYLLADAEKNVQQAQLVLDHKLGRLGNIKGMRQPESESDDRG